MALASQAPDAAGDVKAHGNEGVIEALELAHEGPRSQVGPAQSVTTSRTDRGKCVGENVTAPAGTIHGSTCTENTPACTAASASFNARARSGSTPRIESPRSGSSS